MRHVSFTSGPRRPIQSLYRTWGERRPLPADAWRRVYRARAGAAAAGCEPDRERSKVSGAGRCDVTSKLQRRVVLVEGFHARSSRDPHFGHTRHEGRVLPARALSGDVGAAAWKGPCFLYRDWRSAGKLEE